MDVKKTREEQAPRRLWMAIGDAVRPLITQHEGSRKIKICGVSKRVYLDGKVVSKTKATDTEIEVGAAARQADAVLESLCKAIEEASA